VQAVFASFFLSVLGLRSESPEMQVPPVPRRDTVGVGADDWS
jgi:hypothetical protein